MRSIQFIRNGNMISVAQKRKGKGHSFISMNITDIYGNKLLVYYPSGNNSINISSLPKGNYILNVADTKGKVYSYKFSK